VLGGGGPTGHAWEAGMLKGLRDAGIDVSAADLIVGTSAGAVLGTELRSGKSIEDIYAEELGPQSGNPLSGRSPTDVQYFQDTYSMWTSPVRDQAAMRLEVGQRALQTPHPIPENAQKSRWRTVLGIDAWPQGGLQLAAVDVFDGTTRLFDRTQDASIDAAVAASTSIPGLFAPITVGDHRYMDGGVGGTHADAARGYATVIVVITGGTLSPTQLKDLQDSGSRIAILPPDSASAAAMGTDRRVTSQIKPSAEAGVRQAAVAADDIRKAWTH
jgi:NTE family protein